jgi:hypothetical protein
LLVVRNEGRKITRCLFRRGVALGAAGKKGSNDLFDPHIDNASFDLVVDTDRAAGKTKNGKGEDAEWQTKQGLK